MTDKQIPHEELVKACMEDVLNRIAEAQLPEAEPVSVTCQVAASLLASVASTYGESDIDILSVAADMMGIKP